MIATGEWVWRYGLGLATLLGLLVGSFLNVVIARVPEGQSVVRPRSRCPACGAAISATDNIPVLSWLWLRGRCRQCRGAISVRYPLVEASTAVVAALVYLRTVPRVDLVHAFPGGGRAGMDPVRALSAVPTSGDYLAFLVYFAFFATLLAVSAIDIDHHIIPNVISRPGIGLGVIATVGLERLGTAATTGTQSVLGAAAGYVVLWGVAELGARVLRREAMGMGDAKLLAMIGAFLGAWPTLVVTVMVAAVVGSVVGVGMQVVRRQPIVGSILPFGPFLVLGAAVWFFGGPELVDTWFRALTPASW